MGTLYGKDLVTTQDWSVDELVDTMELAERFKETITGGRRPQKILERKNFFMIFYASSTRTRGAVEAGMNLLGGHALYIDITTARHAHIRAGEALKDIAKMYDIYGDGIGVRILDDAIDFTYGEGRKVVEQFAEVAKAPVINLACCTYHPTQAIGDIVTMKNRLGSLQGKKYVIMWAYSSRLRGRCSIHSEVLIATRFGMDVVLAHPQGFDIDPKIVAAAKQNSRNSDGSFLISHNFREALNGANVVFPRSWVTSELSKVGAIAFGVDKEIKIHSKYKDWRLEQQHVNDLMGKSAIVTHVLPVSRGEEATDEVMEGPNSVIYEQAEDNFYAKMAVLSLTMAGQMEF